MDDARERHFVNAFIRKDRRERLLYELTAPEKRYRGVSRFCHQAGDLLEPKRVWMEGEDLDRRPEFAAFVRQHDEVCYVMSPDSFLDRSSMPLREAVGQAFYCMDAVLILGSSFAVVYGEPAKGGRGKYLLTEPR